MGSTARPTAKAVREFQQKIGLDADGMVGPATLAKLGAFKNITAEVIQRSEIKPSATAPSGETAFVPKSSIWGTIKGLFG